jgi:hypothetical protein
MYFYISDGDELEEVAMYGTGKEESQRNFKACDATCNGATYTCSARCNAHARTQNYTRRHIARAHARAVRVHTLLHRTHMHTQVTPRSGMTAEAVGIPNDYAV